MDFYLKLNFCLSSYILRIPKKKRRKDPIIGTSEVLENIENKSLCYESVPSFKVQYLTLKASFCLINTRRSKMKMKSKQDYVTMF